MASSTGLQQRKRQALSFPSWRTKFDFAYGKIILMRVSIKVPFELLIKSRLAVKFLYYIFFQFSSFNVYSTKPLPN